MTEILKFIVGFSSVTMFITPLTLIIGIINSIKKPEGETKPYTVMAIISAYLIIIPLIYTPFLK